MLTAAMDMPAAARTDGPWLRQEECPGNQRSHAGDEGDVAEDRCQQGGDQSEPEADDCSGAALGDWGW